MIGRNRGEHDGPLHGDGRKRLRARSPLTSKAFLGAGTALAGSGGLALGTPEAGSLLAWLQPYAPAVATLAASFVGGYLIGWGAKRTLRITAIVAAIAIAVIGLLAKFGVDGGAAEAWIQSSVGWVGEHLDDAQQYLTALLPSAASAGTGGVLGFRRT
jgi:uncharacterized membrane protein (Fun14 family)